MKTDCFLCSCSADVFRFALATATLLRLSADDALNLRILRTPRAALNPTQHPSVITMNTTSARFQSMRREQARVSARTDPYILADDDCLPLQDYFCERGLDIMVKYPDFSILGLRPITSTLNKWTPEGYTPFENEEVEEHVSVGGIVFMRRNIDIPSGNEQRFDGVLAEAIRKQGKRVGFFKNLTLNHLGHTYSTLE